MNDINDPSGTNRTGGAVGTDAALAADLASRAGVLLQAFRREFPAGTDDPRLVAKRLRDAADAESQAFLAAELARQRPDDAILSEEAEDSTARDGADRVWIIDPLDGTWEYGMGRSDWAVHVALWQRDATGGRLQVGVVAVPDDGLLFTSAAPQPLPALDLSRPLRIVASRSRPPATLPAIVAALESRWQELGGPPAGEVLSVGSVGAKVSRVLTGGADIYLHDSGFYEWDVAAPLAAAQAAGLSATHLDGSRVTFNHRPPWVTNLAVCRPELSQALAGVLAAEASRPGT
ncbi:MAG: 3(2), 5-bisphosphate nucleotidase [Actinomycetota bacterium]|nr:3(2), 5-bisphosphate nucleotidase [Actinomycetota bacterium]